MKYSACPTCCRAYSAGQHVGCHTREKRSDKNGSIHRNNNGVYGGGFLAIANFASAMGQQIAVDNRAQNHRVGRVRRVRSARQDPHHPGRRDTGRAEIDVAKRKNDEIVHKVIAAVQECGLDKKAIQTDQLSIRADVRNEVGLATDDPKLRGDNAGFSRFTSAYEC